MQTFSVAPKSGRQSSTAYKIQLKFFNAGTKGITKRVRFIEKYPGARKYSIFVLAIRGVTFDLDVFDAIFHFIFYH